MIHLSCLQPAAHADDCLVWKVSTTLVACSVLVLREPDKFELGAERHGWQQEASSRVEREHRERRILPKLADNEKAMLRSQRNPGAGFLPPPVLSLLSDRASLVPGVAAAPPPSAPPSCRQGVAKEAPEYPPT